MNVDQNFGSAHTVKSAHSANVLPHGVDLTMTTLRSGEALVAYTETFLVSQFPSRKAMVEAADTTMQLARTHPQKNLKVLVAMNRTRARLTIRIKESREDFADRMVAEFIAWGGKIGSLTLSKFFLTSMRFIAAGWRP
jgi:hypothetical protein